MASVRHLRNAVAGSSPFGGCAVVYCPVNNAPYLPGKKPDSVLVLMVQLYLDGTWNFPGGQKDEGEDIGMCIRRECFEETRGVVCINDANLPTHKAVCTVHGRPFAYHWYRASRPSVLYSMCDEYEKRRQMRGLPAAFTETVQMRVFNLTDMGDHSKLTDTLSAGLQSSQRWEWFLQHTHTAVVMEDRSKRHLWLASHAGAEARCCASCGGLARGS